MVLYQARNWCRSKWYYIRLETGVEVNGIISGRLETGLEVNGIISGRLETGLEVNGIISG